MSSKDLDDLMSLEFLESLQDEFEDETPIEDSRPEWVHDDKEHTTYKAWEAIIMFAEEKERGIKAYGKVADSKTPKSLYEIKKADVARYVGLSSSSIFRMSSFSNDIRDFLKAENECLAELYEKEQRKQINRQAVKGTRSKKKEDLVDDVQDLRALVKELECRNVKETLDLLLSQLPLDLQRQLKR